MSARGVAVLSRFPLHMAAADPDKRFGAVVGGIADVLDVLTRQIGDLRAAHRLGEAPTRPDLLSLVALHGLDASAVRLLELRLAALVAAASTVPLDPEAIAPLVDLPVDTLTDLDDDLPLVAARPGRHRPSLDLVRGVLGGAIGAHAIGNGTPTALLTATAAYLGLTLDSVLHTEDRWWHLAQCTDLVRLAAPTPVAGEPESPDLTPLGDLVALEENPFRPGGIDPAPKRHALRYGVLRGGLEDVDVTVRVVGIGTRTVRPMVVHVDAGQGLVYEGDVGDGQELAFEASGRVTLAGTEVTGSAWMFSGAVFASSLEVLLNQDFRFADAVAPDPEDDRVATFVVTTPMVDALDPTASFPHGGSAVGPLRLPLGESRWAAFVRVAHFGADLTAPAIPRPSAGRFEGSVFGDDTTPLEPSLSVGYAWQEREPFAVRVILPRRFSTLDDDGGTVLRRPLRQLLDRHRAAGVDLRVEYADPRWSLGVGVLRDTEDNAIGTVLSGTELWPDDTPQPTP